MRGSEWPVGLALGDPMPTLTQNMSHLFKTWKFSAHDPHPIGVMGLARVSILGPPSRKALHHWCAPLQAPRHRGKSLWEDVDGTWLYHRGSVSTHPCKDLAGLNGAKGGKRKVQDGASFSCPSSSSPGHWASSGPTWSSQIAVKVYVVTQNEKICFR